MLSIILKHSFTFHEFQNLMIKAEDKLNHGLTLVMFDNLSGEMVNYCDTGEIKIFAFSDINELFQKLHDICSCQN